jgi:hypothetical protein
MRELLMFTGIPQGSGGQIGPLPNVVRAAGVLEPPHAWVDFNYTGGNENGSHARPWNTLAEGLSATPPSGLMRIKAGSFNSPWTFSSPVRIGGWAGIARIGGS